HAGPGRQPRRDRAGIRCARAAACVERRAADGLGPPQLRDLAVAVLFEAAALAEVVLLGLLAGGEVLALAQGVLVEDLELGELGLGLLTQLGDALAQRGRQGLLARRLDALAGHA